MKLWLPSLGLLVASLGGCRVYDYDQIDSSQEYTRVAEVKRDWSYADRIYVASKDVWWDLVDIASLDTSWGEGLLVNVHATRLGNAGLGYFDGLRCGWVQRAQGTWAERGYEYGLGPFYWKNKTREPVYGNRVLFERGLEYEGFELDKNNIDGHVLDFGARVHLALVGVSVDVSPKEVVDFGTSVAQWFYTVALWPFDAVYDIDPPEIDLSDDNELSRLRRDLGSRGGSIYQPSTPWLERIGREVPPKRPVGEASESELEAGLDPLR